MQNSAIQISAIQNWRDSPAALPQEKGIVLPLVGVVVSVPAEPAEIPLRLPTADDQTGRFDSLALGWVVLIGCAAKEVVASLGTAMGCLSPEQREGMLALHSDASKQGVSG
jgi:hypothetical protein